MTTAPRPHRLVLPLILLLAAAPAGAASWYKVELLLFANLDTGGFTPELVLEDPGEPDTATALPLQGAGARYKLLASNLRSLNAHRLQMDRSGRYEPLAHFAWTQPIGRTSPALAFQVPPPNAGAFGPPALQGTLRMTRGRYLHAELDLLYRERDLAAPIPGAGFQEPAYKLFRMQQKRRMRSKELHYLDSARIGALIIVKPLQAAKPAEEPEAEPEQRDPAPEAAPRPAT